MTLTLDKVIEQLRGLKSELDDAFDRGRIDLDMISSGLEEAAVQLQSIRKIRTGETTQPHNTAVAAGFHEESMKTRVLDAGDYR